MSGVVTLNSNNEAILKKLPAESSTVFKWFLALTQVLRPSHSEKYPDELDKARNVVADWIRKLGGAVEEDSAHNLLVRIPATSGLEDVKVFGLQAHLDIVPAGTFQPDGSVAVSLEEGWLTASGKSTLGGDDGIGVATMLAILEERDSFKHGPIELLFTMDEETGMDGAVGLEGAPFLKSTAMLNLDSEDWGEFCTSCAGSVDFAVTFAGELETITSKSYRIELSGLKSGHSGVEIHKNLPSAFKWIAWTLQGVKAKWRFISINGGSAHNAIPNSCVVEIATDEFEDFEWEIQRIHAERIREFTTRLDGGNPILRIRPLKEGEISVFTRSAQRDLLELLQRYHQGVWTMSPYVAGLVNSSQSVGIISTEGSVVKFGIFARSNDPALVPRLPKENKKLEDIRGVKVVQEKVVPPWLAAPGSRILDLSVACFKKLFGYEPATAGIHAGVECGVLISKYPDLQCVSMGPTVKNVHTIGERLEVESSAKFAVLVKEIVARWADGEIPI